MPHRQPLCAAMRAGSRPRLTLRLPHRLIIRFALLTKGPHGLGGLARVGVNAEPVAGVADGETPR